ncbi:MAG: leucine-rich repeat domain-containing protein [Bacteroidia bacterium]
MRIKILTTLILIGLTVCGNAQDGFGSMAFDGKVYRGIVENIDKADSVYGMSLWYSQDEPLAQLAKFNNLTYLNLGGQKPLPLDSIFQYIQNTKIEHLMMYKCEVSQINKNISYLKGLNKISLSNNLVKDSLSFINLGSLPNLEFLDIRRNDIQTIPNTFCNLVNLRYLQISGNKLSELPDSFGRLNQLEELQIWSNDLQVLPESFGNLSKLKVVSFAYNKRFELSKNVQVLSRLPNLKELNLLSTGLTSIPSNINQISSLEILDIGNNPKLELTQAFESLSNCRTLKHLGLGVLDIRSLPESFKQLDQIESIDLDANRSMNFEKVFSTISKTAKIKSISMSMCELRQIPISILKLKYLEELSIRQNSFDLANEIAVLSKIKHLRKINASFNQAFNVTEEFKNLSHLEELVIQGVKLSDQDLIRLQSYLPKTKIIN